jgi:hypothetical protein
LEHRRGRDAPEDQVRGAAERTAPAAAGTRLQVVAAVTRRAGATFVKEFYKQCQDTGAWGEAMSSTHPRLFPWPDNPDPQASIADRSPLQDEYIALEDAIIEELEKRLKRPLAQLFIDVSSDLLARYRSGELALDLPPRREPAPLVLPAMEPGLEGGRAILGKAIATQIALGIVKETDSTSVAASDGTITETLLTDAKRVPVPGQEVFLGLPADTWRARDVVGLCQAVEDDGTLRMGDKYSGGTIAVADIASGRIRYFGVVVDRVRPPRGQVAGRSILIV